MTVAGKARGVCIIGAGSSGLAAARNFIAEGFEVEVYEREMDLGGIWNYESPAARVYASTSMISSKPFTQYPDFGMPDHFPDYPHHQHVLSYLRDYSRQFGLERHIRLGAGVACARPSGDEAAWDVTLSSGETLRYAVLVVANGHNSVPRSPSYPGEFAGEVIHSAHYRDPAIFSGKRVLVVGRGNSGCDIAVEAAETAAKTFSSARRGYYFVPKYFAGVPSDQLGDVYLRKRVPLERRREVTLAAIEAEVGRLEECGLPLPDHQIFETHPVVNTAFPLAVKSGRIQPKGDLAHLDGSVVHFLDGSSETVDTIVFATGYRLELPFLALEDQPVSSGWDPLVNVFHRRHDNLFFAGFIQPDGGQFGLVHWQMRAAALYAAGVRDRSADRSKLASACASSGRSGNGGVDYVRSPRHLLEVEHWSYLALLKQLVAALEQ